MEEDGREDDEDGDWIPRLWYQFDQFDAWLKRKLRTYSGFREHENRICLEK